MPRRRLWRISLLVVLNLVAITSALSRVRGQLEIIPLQVETSVTVQLSADSPTQIFSFNVAESLRMGFVFEVLEGDMQPTLVVYDQDGQTVLAGSTGRHNNGVIVRFPSQGQYLVALSAAEGTSASYRLMIDADPPLPLDASVMQSYLVAGTSARCEENIPVTRFSPEEDFNVCFTLASLTEPLEVTVQWWSPQGSVVVEERFTADASMTLLPMLSGIVYPGTPQAEGWWQVHFLLNGQLAHIQWVYVGR